MDDKVFALITVMVSGAFAVLVTVVTHWLARSRESQTLLREVRRDEIAQTQALYEEAIFILDRTCHTLGLGTNDDRNHIIRFMARLYLIAPQEVRDQYMKTSDRVVQWATQARKGEPQAHNGILIFYAGADAEKAKAEKAWPEVERELNELRHKMKKHLADLASGLTIACD